MSPPPQRCRPILTAAVEVFAERGYEGATVDHLLAATALDYAAFERRFTDKQGCFLAAYDRIVAVAHTSVAGGLSEEASWAARLAAGLWAVLELADANPAAARLVLVESQLAGQLALERFAATLEAIASFMGEGRQCPTAPAQLPPIIHSVLPAGVAFSLRLQILGGGSARDLYAELLRFLLLPYLGEAETTARLALSPPGPRVGEHLG
jgi:AcrR family transcriptional regulator